MKLPLLLALSLCMTGVALAATPTAAACLPFDCPGYGHCEVKHRDSGAVQDLYVPLVYVQCYW